MNLTDEDGSFLVKLARRSVESSIKGTRFDFTPPTQKLTERRGVFVTIKKKGELRGCIGFPFPVAPLCESVVKAARLAAFEDPRFPPITREELGKVIFEVSVLSVPERSYPESIEVGKHGVIVRKGPFSGLLLPQVAVEQGWTREEFLSHASIKAGLPPDAWRDAEIYTFTAEIFSEIEPEGRITRVSLLPR